MKNNLNVNDLSQQLLTAIEYTDDINSIKDLLNQGASPLWNDKYGRTALHCAAEYGKVEFLEILLENGVNIDVKENGGTPLQIAARNGNLECCEYLLQKGANGIIKDNNGYTTLHYAASGGSLECCQLFLNEGVDINSVNNRRESPLYYGDFECCKFLMERKADGNIMNNNGETPLLYKLRDGYISNNRLKLCKYYFEAGILLQKMPKSWINDEQIKNYKSLEVCWKWWKIQQNNKQELLDIPDEILFRGPEAIDMYFNELLKSQNRIYFSRICVVGPSGWGKTSLIKSLISSIPTQESEDLRTIGIDQFQWRFDVAKKSINLPGVSKTVDPNTSIDTERHQVNIWDFAGQDVYKGTHSIFFSSCRTLFLICVNLEVYEQDIMNDGNDASDEIIRWIRLVFAKQPNAKLLFVGTKADLVNEYAIQTIRKDLLECVQHWCDNYSTDINSRQLFSGNGKVQMNLRQLQIQLSNLKHAVHQNWVITSSQDEHTLKEACVEIQYQIRDSKLGFIMPNSYTAVLDYLYQLRQDAQSITNSSSTETINNNDNKSKVDDYNSGENSRLGTIFCSLQNLRGRIRMNVRQLNDDGMPKNSGEPETNQLDLDEILNLFNDLGEILLFNNIKLNKKKGVAIVDPGLMIDLVRDIVRHDLCHYLEHCNQNIQLKPSDWKDQLKNGVVPHTILQVLKNWSKLTSAQILVAKELLHECKILHPIGEITFGYETNVAVPALWFLNKEMTSSTPDMETVIAKWYTETSSISRMCWKYVFSADTFPDSFFELFIVKSYNHTTKQTVSRCSLEEWVPKTSSLGLITISHSDSPHSIIMIEIASNTKYAALDLLRYYIAIIETLLQDYPGVSKTPYYVELRSNGEQTPFVVNNMSLTSRLHVHTKEEWLNNNLFCWYLEKLWETPAKRSNSNEDNEVASKLLKKIIENQEGMKDKLDISIQNQEKLSNSLDAIIQLQYKGEENRQLPALWTAELDNKKSLSQIRIRMLSDISGKCFHIDKPIEIDVPFKLLSKYGEKLKYGLNIISLVTPRSIRLDKLDISGIVEKAEKIHNLIDGCNLETHGILNSGTDSQMSPNESRLLLIDLLTLYDPKFTLDHVPRLSGLVCGFINETGHHFWATEEEIKALGDKVTLRSVGPIDVNLLLGAQKFSVDLHICQVEGLLSTDQKKAFVKWELLDMNNSNGIIQDGYTSLYQDASAEPNWKDAVWNITLEDFDHLKQYALRINVQRSRKIPIYKYREIKDLGSNKITFLDILQSYTTPPQSIPINVEVFMNQKKTCTVKCQLECSSRNSGNSSSTVVP